MKVIEQGEPVHVPFDAAHEMLAAGAVEIHPHDGERGPDQPAAQMPKPGVDPIGGKEETRSGEVLTNLAEVGLTVPGAPGLPKEPAPPAETVTAAPKVDPVPVKVVDVKPAAPAKADTKA